jgi:organic radical activating enzyme
MSYTVKEIFYSLQGEGHHSGRPAVFCRFSGCNLWSGREEDRARAQCTFCDTDFVGVGPDGGKFADAQALARRIAGHWPAQGGGTPYVVCTGGIKGNSCIPGTCFSSCLFCRTGKPFK